MNTVIFHLGTHKAASTSIQFFLAQNRAKLEEHGVLYPRPPTEPHFAHHGIAWGWMRKYNKRERRPDNYSLDDALRDYSASGCNYLLLSTESFLNVSFYDDLLNDVFGRLRQVFDKIVVCAYVRNRKGFFTSSYNQWVKSLGYAGSFDAYFAEVLEDRRPQMRYTQGLDCWARHADQAVFLPFLPQSFEQSVERRLISALGLDQELVDALADASGDFSNPSIGPLAILAFRQVSARLTTFDWYDWYDIGGRKKLQRALIDETDNLGWNAARFKVFDEQRLQAIDDEFRPADQDFSRRHFGADWDTVFPEDSRIDGSSERSFESLSPTEQETMNELVERTVEFARECFCSPPLANSLR